MRKLIRWLSGENFVPIKDEQAQPPNNYQVIRRSDREVYGELGSLEQAKELARRLNDGK